MINEALIRHRKILGLFCSKLADDFSLWLHPVVRLDEHKYLIMNYICDDRVMKVAFSDTINLVSQFDLDMIVLPTVDWPEAAKRIAEFFYLDYGRKQINEIIDDLKNRCDTEKIV